jgi:hypothetical protein
MSLYEGERQSVSSPRPVYTQYLATVSNCQTITQPKRNRRISHNQSNGNLFPLKVLHVIFGHIPESREKKSTQRTEIQ